MTNGKGKSVWTQLSSSFADTIAHLENSIVAIDGGGRSTTSGVVWQPGVIVTTHHGLRLRENLKIIPQSSEPFKKLLDKFLSQETEIENFQKQIRQLQTALQTRQRNFETFVAGLTVE